MTCVLIKMAWRDGRFLRVPGDWHEEPIGVFFTLTGHISHHDKDELVSHIIVHTPDEVGNRVTEKYVNSSDSDEEEEVNDQLFVFVKVSAPLHSSCCSVLRERVFDKLNPRISCKYEYVYGELDARVFEWSVGQESNDEDFMQLSEILSYLPKDKPCVSYCINISGHAYSECEGWELYADFANGAAGNHALWKILRNRVFATRDDGLIADFDWFG